MTSSRTAAVEVVTKGKKRRRTSTTTNHRRGDMRHRHYLRELPLFPLTPGDLKQPQPTAVDAADPNDDVLLVLRLGYPPVDDHEENIMVGPEEEEAAGNAGAMVAAAVEEEEEVVWQIRKVLTKSDTNACSRLLVMNDMARDHVLPYLTAEEVERVESGGWKAAGAVDVTVRDADTGTEHKLQFRKWNSTNCYLLNNEWQSGFVKRRQLKEGDEMGLYFDPRAKQFVFSVLNRAPPAAVDHD